MTKSTVTPTGKERTFGNDELIVSKTDLKGCITYANHVFCRVSGYTESELLGIQHSIIRHPEMPRCVFKLLWDTIQSGEEIFAYVVNSCKNGDHYWVFAHVTPTLNSAGKIVGYHSSRRVPDQKAIKIIKPIYAMLCKEEESHKDRKIGMQSAFDTLVKYLTDKGTSYEQFIFALH